MLVNPCLTSRDITRSTLTRWRYDTIHFAAVRHSIRTAMRIQVNDARIVTTVAGASTSVSAAISTLSSISAVSGPDSPKASKYKSVQRFGSQRFDSPPVVPTSASNAGAGAGAGGAGGGAKRDTAGDDLGLDTGRPKIQPVEVRMGTSAVTIEEDQMVWAQLIYWLDAQLAAHTVGYSL
jgi:hypothetical protein